jgi:hypothetical protein
MLFIARCIQLNTASPPLSIASLSTRAGIELTEIYQVNRNADCLNNLSNHSQKIHTLDQIELFKRDTIATPRGPVTECKFDDYVCSQVRISVEDPLMRLINGEFYLNSTELDFSLYLSLNSSKRAVKPLICLVCD